MAKNWDSLITALTLTRSDPTKNLHRDYRLDVQPDLFGAGASSANGAAFGQRDGQSRTVPYPAPAETKASPRIDLMPTGCEA